MSTIVTRAGKGSALTHNEVDANFTNLNTDKIQSGNTVAALTITSATIAGGTITGITDLAVADGGTGASNASGARTNLGGTTVGVGVFTAATVAAAQQAMDVEVGVDVQAYDVDTAKLDNANTWTQTQTFDVVKANFIYASNLPAVGSFTWDTNTSSPAAAISVGSPVVTSVHAGMRRCLLNDSGVVQYYLNPTNSAQKLDGTSSVLTGADGMVMVEIPKFYTRREVSGTYVTWSISAVPLPGFTLHPAFTKNGVEVNFRYYSAYDACAFDVSSSTFISGLNRDNAVSNTPNVDVTASTGDVLASVSGVYPMVGLTRAQFRTIAANRGTGWRQLDWTLWSAAQMLYLVENQSFFSQNILGAGNTNGSYLTQSDDQNQSPNSPAGQSNSLGNASTNTTTGAGVSAKPGTSFMSYRGIENFYGNVWNWADGVIVNPDGTASADQGDWYFTNNSADFSDSVRTNMTQITAIARTGSGFISAVASVDNFFIATSVSGGSSTTFLTDQHFGSTAADRVVLVGGEASDGALAGAFLVNANIASSAAARSIGARLAF
jgi:hypothetical protein